MPEIVIVIVAILFLVLLFRKSESSQEDLQRSDRQETDANQLTKRQKDGVSSQEFRQDRAQKHGQRGAGRKERERLSSSTYHEPLGVDHKEADETNVTGESFQTKPLKPYGGRVTKDWSGYTRGQSAHTPLHREGIRHKNPVYLTQSGLDSLQIELDHLVSKRRPEIAQQIAEAKAEGNVKKNAGYEEAKNAQAFVEGRIRELKVKIHNAQIIDASQTPDDQVALGRSVVIRENGYDDEEVYTIVGSTETAPANGRISNESPIGKALIGRTAGEVVRVKAPKGAIEFEIVRVE
jgi:transcription elongation factor GreA